MVPKMVEIAVFKAFINSQKLFGKLLSEPLDALWTFVND